MSATHVQVVKWSFPAVALIIGLFWYKCRRADRADPGGTPDSDCSDRTLVDCRKETVSSKTNSNFYDSDIHIEESYTLNSSCKSTEEIACSPRKRSESLDIPQRKPGTQTAFIRSKTSSQETKTDIQLGSNPKTSNFETIAKNRSSSSLENAMDVKVIKVFENVAEEEEQKSKDEEHETNNECNYHQSEEQSDTTPSKECSKSPAQALSERDSAMHSPVSGVLEGSVTDEARSEGSADSGKGGSIKDHLKESMMPQTYQFNVPQNLVGRLIGVHRSFLQSIQIEANVDIYVDYHPSVMNLKLCRITGSSEGIKVALEMIRQKFPENKFPELTLEQILPFNDWLTEFMQLSLVGGVNNDVVICHIVKPNRFFVQLPTHPTYPYLWTLVDSMTKSYNTTDSPSVPEELTKGMLLVANWQNRWVRACIEEPDPNGERHLVRLVDHGGYWYFSSVDMKKIRSDYLTLPFQAIEVFLANVQPTNGKWSQDAYDVVFHLCCGTVGQAQIGGYINSSTYVNIYLNIPKYGVISLADELIVRKLAYATPLECIVPEEGITVSYPTI